MVFFFFFQAEDGIRDLTVTGVQTCALPIFGGPDSAERSFVHRVEVVPHSCDRPRVVVAALRDAGRVADPDPEQEATRVGVRKRPGAVGRCHRVARVDVQDPAPDDGALRPGKQRRGLGEALLRPHTLAEPDRPVAQLLELGCELTGFRGRPQAQRPQPDSDAAQLHQLVSSTKQMPFFGPVAVATPSQKVGWRSPWTSWSGTSAFALTARCCDGTWIVQSSGQLRPAPKNARLPATIRGSVTAVLLPSRRTNVPPLPAADVPARIL